MLRGFLKHANSWDPKIQLERDIEECGKSVSFLDLVISITEVDEQLVCNYQTHRKTQCMYQYTPYDSCHSRSQLNGIPATEVHRLLMTNRSQMTFAAHLGLMTEKLAERGSIFSVVQDAVLRKLWVAMQIIFLPLREPLLAKLVAFKYEYTFEAERLDITALRHNRLHMMKVSESNFKFVCCYNTANNIIRLRCSRFLK